MQKKTVRAYVLKFPENQSYRARPRFPLDDLQIRDVAAIDDPIVKTWEHMLTLLKYYERLYNVSFSLRRKKVSLQCLVPTQPQVLRRQIDSIKEIVVPIFCVEHRNRFFILDGHARSLHAKQLGSESVEAMLLSPQTKIDFGIVRTAKEMGLKCLEDIIIVEIDQRT